ncbi:right-handed parallel beta-helix repeat-containing protein [Aquisphaera insulae]|uniref:right-handed parallel beta-helix repeat-containing protein n=1 Tax=Aquisphaera insulae TaxID=2712864 RepID=UPI0013ED4F8F|nr:right-handed parallel beta-helix repeat-containing protein [Aquisphaera insulae]
MSLFGRARRRSRIRGKGPRTALHCERFEERVLLANFLVTNTAATGAGSLRQAILGANGAVGPDTIAFNIPDNGTGIYRIDLAAATGVLPAITGGVTIDGTSQATFLGKAAVVEINGGALPSGDGLTLAAGSDGSLIDGLTIFGFNGNGILVQSNGNTIGGTAAGGGNVLHSDAVGVNLGAVQNNVLLGNLIGTDSSGTNFGGMARGILVAGGSLNTIGGSAAGERNIIDFATAAGIELDSAAAANRIGGNLIGTDATASVDRGNAVGVLVSGATNTIGGANDGNTIGFSSNAGILISGTSAATNRVESNFIGTNAAGANLHNLFGVQIDRAGGNTIGGAAAGNQIDFNTGAGILITGPTSAGNLIGTNLIGTNSAGSANRGNAYGIQILNSSGNTIGGAAGLANTIGFSTQQGVSVLTGSGNLVSRNLYAGGSGAATDIIVAPGANNGIAAPVLNSVSVDQIASTLTLSLSQPAGGTQPVDLEVYSLGAGGSRTFRTTISGQSLTTTPQQITLPNVAGITTADTILVTATDATRSTSPFSNAASIGNALVVTTTGDSGSGSLRTAITDALAASNPVITFNIPGAGPHVITLSTPLPALTKPIIIDATSQPDYAGTPTVILIGSSLAGSSDGIVLGTGSGGSEVKGLALGGFGGAAIRVQTSNNRIAANFIGVDTTGKAAGPGNGTGVLIDAGSGNTVGGSAAADRNVIGLNTTGLSLASGGNVVLGNFIGVADAATHDSVANSTGVSISAAGNTVGGSAANILGFNGTSVLVAAAVTSAVVSNNFIGTDASGHNLGAGGLFGVRVQGNNGVISGNTIDFLGSGAAIALEGGSNAVTGNRLGTRGVAGSPPTFSNAIDVAVTGSGNTVGGATAAAANVIGFASVAGVQIGGGAANTVVQGNFIGTDASGGILTNNIGVQVQSGSGSSVGGPAASQANVIANYAIQGVSILAGSGNLVSRNRYVGGPVPTADIALAPGANGNIAAPVLASASLSDSNTKLTIAVSLPVAGSQPVNVEVYIGGTSRVYRTTVAGAMLSTSSQLFTFDVAGISISDSILVTVSDGGGNTSAFSNAVSIGSALVVTSTEDGVSGSLRSAILNVMAGIGTEITFAIPGAGPHVLTLDAPLPTITTGITINGTSQPGYVATPLILLVGSKLSAASFGIDLGAGSSGSTIEGLSFLGFAGAAVHVGSSDNVIRSNFVGVGLDATGKLLGPGNGTGIVVDAGSGNTIGGAGLARNVIGGNAIGISLASGGNVVAGNFIGVADAATRDNIANTTGVQVSAASGNTIGGTTANTFGFNVTSVLIAAAARDTVVANNFIGTDASGADLGAGTVNGVNILGQASTIGGTASGTANVIGFASGAGIRLGAGATGNSVQGNLIGISSTDLATAASLPNNIGVLIDGAVDNTIGSAKGAEGSAGGNTIGGNAGAGISVASGTANRINGNLYLKANGPSQSPVQSSDIVLSAGANGSLGSPGLQAASYQNLIVTATVAVTPLGTAAPLFELYQITEDPTTHAPLQRRFLTRATGTPSPDGPSHSYDVKFDVLADLTGKSLLVTSTQDDNSAGTDLWSTSPFSNVVIAQAPNVVSTVANTGTGSLRNVIVYVNGLGQAADGTIKFDPDLFGSPQVIALQSALQPITHRVTMDGLGNARLTPADAGSTFDGLVLAPGSDQSVIAGLSLFGFRAGSGLVINSGGNRIRGSYFGIDPDDPLANHGNAIGILLEGGAGNTIGGEALADRVFVAANGVGIRIAGNPDGRSGSRSNTIVNTTIGTTVAIDNKNNGNKGDGIRVSDSTGNTIGSATTDNALRVLISGNGGGTSADAGIHITGAGSSGNVVANSLIGTSPTGNSGGGSYANRIGVLLDSGANSNAIGYSADLPWAAVGPVANVISGNLFAGVKLDSADRNQVAGNRIGTDLTGTVPLGNGAGLSDRGGGIWLDGGSGNSIGGASAAERNTISGNSRDGIYISFSSPPSAGAVANTILNNLISRNVLNGIHLVGDLRGAGPGSSNPPAATLVVVSGNLIGTTPDGKQVYDPVTAISQGNGLSGILLEQASGATTKGGSVPAAAVTGNTISGNGLSGVTIQHTAGVANGVVANVSVGGNVIGLAADGVTAIDPQLRPVGNVLDGILIDGVQGVTVGVRPLPGSLPAGPSNVISGNLGRGIEIRGAGTAGDPIVISGNYIGTDRSGEVVSPTGSAASTVGNLSDGIFLLGAPNAEIAFNLISANRGAGIHLAGGAQTAALTIRGNYIGTDRSGALVQQLTDPTKPASGGNPPLVPAVYFGNGSDGLFLDNIKGGVTVGGTADSDRNLIAGNRANGIDLLQSRNVVVQGNWIGTNSANARGLGNSSNGIFINGSSENTIGGDVAAASNVIAGNLASGIFISEGSDASSSTRLEATRNQIRNNLIGLGMKPDSNGNLTNPNRVSGLVISGGTYNEVSGNTISGNLLYGILLANNADYNTLELNYIGTDRDSHPNLGNTSEGIFLIGGSDSNTNAEAVGNRIAQNTISGNQGNGIHLFGTNTAGNTISGNLVGLDATGKKIPNQGNGIYLDSTGLNATATSGALLAGPNSLIGNVISGNGQHGVLIYATEATPNPAQGQYRNILRGNFIGTDQRGTHGVANGGSGVFIYGSSQNDIGGVDGGSGGQLASAITLGVSQGNLISGNAQAGITLFSPVPNLPTSGNTIQGNFIGTDAAGMAAVPNSDGVDILSAQRNLIGGVGYQNLISGNSASGVYITQLTGIDATGNHVAANFIGTDRTGSARLEGSPQVQGVFLDNVSGNLIGGADDRTIDGSNVPLTPRNVISGNAQAGVRIGATSFGNLIEGNYIGVGRDGTSPSSAANLTNVVGVLIADQAHGNVIGGAAPGAGNLITQGNLRDGNTGKATEALTSTTAVNIGVETVGPGVTSNYVQGNLIGLDATGRPVFSAGGVVVNQIGVLINGSPNNIIGGASSDPNRQGLDPVGFAPATVRNVISGNAQAGVEITGPNATGNLVRGNFIGTNIAGTAPPSVPYSVPTQIVGVYILNAHDNVVGGHGFGNLISGNQIGVTVAGPATASASSGAAGSNLVQENLIGTDRSGMAALPNLEFGIFVNGSPNNLISHNLLSANGLAGVEISGGGSQVGGSQSATGLNDTISGNLIGTNIRGEKAFPRDPADVNATTNPIISTAGNPVYYGLQLHGVVILGTSTNNVADNLIAGNIYVGVYITRRDFDGTVYALPVNNRVQTNQIIANGIYGVLRYDAPQNAVAQGRAKTRRGKPTGANTFVNNPIALADYITGLNSRSKQRTLTSTLLPTGPATSTASASPRPTTGKAHPKGPKARRKG